MRCTSTLWGFGWLIASGAYLGTPCTLRVDVLMSKSGLGLLFGHTAWMGNADVSVSSSGQEVVLDCSCSAVVDWEVKFWR